ncbi:5'-methylthioadenosine/adenosylhomocysteine nucleosidase [Buchnera aphidicola (Taiwanaphis decaspermi)]|uniref:5'-methylthioadenosine/adenosylhomocysteine nucleosidase n=1 Tax=Buchnera aphidicola TaxID=9 RepID=UPI0031B8A02D
MKIGVIVAIKKEAFLIYKKIKNKKKIKICGFKIYFGKVYNFVIYIIISGIGKVSATISSMILINNFDIKIMINIGSAGSLSNKYKIGTILIPNKIGYHDVDVTAFKYKLGQIPKIPAFMKINKIIFNKFKNKIISEKKIITGLLLTGDQFINKKRSINILKKFPKAIAVDMESCAISHVCYKFKIPIIVIKSISDFSNEKSHYDFKNFLSLSVYNSSKILFCVLENFNIIKNNLSNF